MGFRRRSRRRGLIAGAAIAHHEMKKRDEREQEGADAQYEEDMQSAPQAVAPPPADPADQIEHLAKLHESGALTDDEFAAAKAKALGS